MFPYFALDIETTGLDKETDSILEVSLVFDNGDGHIMDLPSLSVVIQYHQLSGNIEALLMHAKNGLLAECLASSSFSSYLIPQVNTFLATHGGERATIAGKNIAGFDLPFLCRHAERHNQTLVPISHRVLDVGSLYADNSGIPSLKDICTRVGIVYGNHRSLEDCRTVVDLIRRKLG